MKINNRDYSLVLRTILGFCSNEKCDSIKIGMNKRDKRLNYELTPRQAALIEWGKRNRHGRIDIIFQDGNPAKAIIPTKDGFGTETILFDKVARNLGLM